MGEASDCPAWNVKFLFPAEKQNVSGLETKCFWLGIFLEHTDSERSKALFAHNNVKKKEKGVGMEEKV